MPSKINEFHGKTWIFVAQFLMLGGLGAFSLIAGILFLLGIIKAADGRPSTEAGIPMTIMSVPFLAIATLAAFNIKARGSPIIRICDQGLEINIIGSSMLDGIPMIPGIVRVAWLIISFQGFRNQIIWVPWSTFRSVEISGLPMSRRLSIFAVLYASQTAEQTQQPPVGNQVAFQEVEFEDSLEEIAATIQDFADAYKNPNYWRA